MPSAGLRKRWEARPSAERRSRISVGGCGLGSLPERQPLEWTAQWLLRERAGIDTADVPEDRIPAGLACAPNRDGRGQAGLYAAWELVREHVPGGPREFAERVGKRMLNHLQTRNESILAHGFRPVTADGWSGFRGFIEQDFLSMLREQTAQAEFRMEPPQLPTTATWDAVGG